MDETTKEAVQLQASAGLRQESAAVPGQRSEEGGKVNADFLAAAEHAQDMVLTPPVHDGQADEEDGQAMPAARMLAEYKAWIAAQDGDWGQFVQDENGNFSLENALAIAQVNFYLEDLVEIMVTMKADNALKYYLHFQLNDLDYARSLFHEMAEAFAAIEERKNVRVLLCCTSGATTGFFASQLNEAARAMNLQYEFDAVAYWRLYEQAPNFDVILLAPQVAYKLKNVQNSLPKKLVLLAPTVLFTANDSYQTFQFLDAKLAEFKTQIPEDKHKDACSCHVQIQRQSVLCIGCVIGSESCRTYYQLWDGDRLVVEDSMKRPRRYGFNLKECIESVQSRTDHLDLIMLGMPGIVSAEGKVMHLSSWQEKDYPALLEDLYHVPVKVMNSANAAVLAFAQDYPDAHTLIFHSQVYGSSGGGQGIMVNGQLVTGKNGLSGENSTFLKRMQFSNDLDVLCKTDAGMMEIVSKSLLPSIGLLAPDVIGVRSAMTSDMCELHEKLAELLPERFIPELVYVDNIESYLLRGLKKQSETYFSAVQS